MMNLCYNDTSDFCILDRLFVRAFSEYWRIFCKFSDNGSYKSVNDEIKVVCHIWPQYIVAIDGNTCQIDIKNESVMNDVLSKYTLTRELQVAFELLIRISQALNLISCNDLVDDIHTEHIKYLMLPYLISHVLLEKPDVANRLCILKRVYIYLNEFMYNMSKFGILRREEYDIWSRDAVDDVTKSRANKIEQAKYEQELKKNLNRVIDSCSSVEVFISLCNNNSKEELYRSTLFDILKLFSIQTLGHLDFIRIEMSYLELKSDIKAVKNENHNLKKSENKPWFIHIDPNTKLDPSLIHELYKHMVFVPSHELPSISLDDCARIEMNMDVNTIGKKRDFVKRNESGESLIDYSGTDDSDTKSDATENLAEWDDWKDDHPRGIGNKNINIG